MKSLSVRRRNRPHAGAISGRQRSDRAMAAQTSPQSVAGLSDEYAITSAKYADSLPPPSHATGAPRSSFLQHLKAAGILDRPHPAQGYRNLCHQAGKRLSRGSLQHDIAALRGFLRFLATDGRVPPGWICRSTRRDSTAWSNSLAPSRGKRFAHCCNPWTRLRPWACATTRCFC